MRILYAKLFEIRKHSLYLNPYKSIVTNNPDGFIAEGVRFVALAAVGQYPPVSG
jgi:hypothetical protein